MKLLQAGGCVLAYLGTTNGFTMNLAAGRNERPANRRDAVAKSAKIAVAAPCPATATSHWAEQQHSHPRIPRSTLCTRPGVTGVLAGRPAGANAAVKVNKSLGQDSFRRIRDARKQLDSVDVPLRSRKFEEVQALLDNGPTAGLEKSLVDLVQSNSLPADDKVTVGTIRRYGLAADALIALGGLSAAARDEDGGEARRMLILTKESLNDILTIGVNNNLNKTD